MLDDIREWISDNLRYLLLGLAGILILVIVIFVIKFATGGGKDKTSDTEVTSEKNTEQEEEETVPGAGLEKDVPEVLEVMKKYYDAWADKDLETLKAIDPALSAEDEAAIQNNDAIESFNNITVYSSEGLTEGSYIVYVYFDAKIQGISTLAPTLIDFYLQKDEFGNLVMVDKYSTQELSDFTEKMQASKGVQALIQEVNQKLVEATEGDDDLKAYVVSLQSGNSTGTGNQGSDGNTAGTTGDAPEVNSKVKATTEVRVRSEASTNGVIYGMLTTGAEATILENLDSGWSKIQYTANGTTIEGYVMTQYLEAAE